MARSSYIYLVLSTDSKPVAAFTVKHECKDWLTSGGDLLSSWVTRVPDGRSAGTCPTWTIQEFLEDSKYQRE